MRDKTKYNAYINSPEWQEKRKEVFDEKWYKCEACGISESLHVHHGTYRRLYKEKISDLFVLCWYCHMSLHDKYGTRDLLRATNAFIQWQDLIPRKTKTKKKKIKQSKIELVHAKLAIYWTFYHTRWKTRVKFDQIMSQRNERRRISWNKKRRKK